MVTARNRIERTARRLARIADLGMFVCFLSLPVMYWLGKSSMDLAGALILSGLVIFASFFIALHAIGIRCSRCTNRLERYYRVSFLCFRGPESCPHCGLDFDRPAY
jgi:hypothetical protein